MLKIAIPRDISAPGKDYLLARGYTLSIGSGSRDPETVAAEISDADGVLARIAPYTAEVLSHAKKLKVIGRHGAGVDCVDVDYCRAHGIRVTYTPVANTESVAEHAIGLMLCLSHRLVPFDKAVREDDWLITNRLPTADLFGRTLGIVGCGHIGLLTAEMAIKAFSMRCIGYAPRPPKLPLPVGMQLVDSLERLAAESDYVSLHVPSTKETRGMVDAAFLRGMKQTAFLVNTARGDVVNERDLIAALREGVIAGAGLDVLTREPPLPDNPLFQLQNVVLSPHSGALTQESLDRMGLHAAMGIDDVLSGREPQWPVV